MATDITVAFGDGIGPEIMDATLFVLKEAKANINIDTIEVGEAYYNRGVSTGIPPHAWDSLRRTKLLLKAPITTPMGGGYKSLNVTIRKTLGLYANIRPCRSFAPYVSGMSDIMDMVIIRENEEDLYAGIEYRHTQDAYHAHKVITRSGSEKIIRYAFDYAVQNGRKKVTCMVKDNIMKMSDGAFAEIFNQVGTEYPDIEKDRFIIDIGSARVASKPELFDVIVTENLYGDIISDIAADVCGSVGLAGSSNVGDDFAMFEAIHGSAPDIAGKNIANPSGLINGAVMMLVHIGQNDVAATIRNAWLKAIEDGMHTGDIHSDMSKGDALGTKEFTQAVVDRLGEVPSKFKKEEFKPLPKSAKKPSEHIKMTPCKKTLTGADVFIGWHEDIDSLGNTMKELEDETLELALISTKGLKVWPDTETAPNFSDSYRCRYRTKGNTLSYSDIAKLNARAAEKGLDILQVINLFDFEGKDGFTKSQGE